MNIHDLEDLRYLTIMQYYCNITKPPHVRTAVCLAPHLSGLWLRIQINTDHKGEGPDQQLY